MKGNPQNNIQDVKDNMGHIQKDSSPIQFSVRVEVEECNGEGTSRNDFSILRSIPNSVAGQKNGKAALENHTEHTDNIPFLLGNKTEKNFIIRNILRQKKRRRNFFTMVNQYIVTTETIIQAADLQSKENKKDFEKYIDAAVRNLLGQFNKVSLTYYDHEVNKVMRTWMDWYVICPRFRSIPLLYKCYVCYRGWWRLHPFKEHLKEHNDSSIKLKTEPYEHEFFVVACNKKTHKALKVHLDSSCWRCGRDGKVHQTTNKILKYECEGCKQQMVTCTKLKEHESICKEYLKINYLKYKVNASENTTCQLCCVHYATKTLLDTHMVDCHSVRTDEPAVTSTKVCKLCNHRYHHHKFHDCPEKHKGFKCDFCCRKFASLIFLHMHLQFTKGKIQCTVCRARMVKCQAAEHYLQHTNNYVPAYWCGSCDNNLLFTDETIFRDHMNHFNTTVAKRRWGIKLLLPRKCVTGEVVKSAKVFELPDKKLHNFLWGIEDAEYDLTGESVTNQNIVDDAEKNVIVLDDDDKNDVQRSNATRESIKIENQDPDIWAMQAQLDAEIMRDIEMEAEISKVFTASKSYLKFMEKESMIAESQRTESMEEEEDLYSNDLIIIDNQEEDVTVITDSECEETIEDNATEYRNAKSTVIVSDSVDSCTQEVLDISDADDNGEHLDIDMKEEIDLEPEEEENSVRRSSEFEEDSDWNVDTLVKEETEDNVGAAVETKPDLSLSHSDEAAVKHEGMAQEDFAGMLNAIADVKREIDSEGCEREEKLAWRPPTAASDSRVYECKGCFFIGELRHYVVHVVSTCKGTVFGCGGCEERFPDARRYLDHMVDHGYEHLQCPECKTVQRFASTLYSHVTSHIRGMFLRFRSIHGTRKSPQDSLLYRCRKCKEMVEIEQFFGHWERHLHDRPGDGPKTEECASEEDGDTDNSHIAAITPEQVKQLTDLLLINEKKVLDCIVCPKKFSRTSDCKRHLIEHLLIQAFLNKPKTDYELRCSFCPLQFATDQEWKEHMREHASLPAYKCDLCSKSFSDSSNYSKHRKVHNLFSFICDHCGGKYRAKRSLIEHLKLHEKEPLLCKVCGMPFVTQSRLRKHQRSRHKVAPHSYPCMICRRRFRSVKQKWEHMWLKHQKRQYKADCPICNKAFRRRQDVKSHLKVVHKVKYRGSFEHE
ncbi:unnamed protein product, partial [Iphiclides podalirius]